MNRAVTAILGAGLLFTMAKCSEPKAPGSCPVKKDPITQKVSSDCRDGARDIIGEIQSAPIPDEEPTYVQGDPMNHSPVAELSSHLDWQREQGMLQMPPDINEQDGVIDHGSQIAEMLGRRPSAVLDTGILLGDPKEGIMVFPFPTPTLRRVESCEDQAARRVREAVRLSGTFITQETLQTALRGAIAQCIENQRIPGLDPNTLRSRFRYPQFPIPTQ